MEKLSEVPADQKFAVINLLRYNEWAEYPPGTVTEKLTGQQAYERYAELSTPFVNQCRRCSDVARASAAST